MITNTPTTGPGPLPGPDPLRSRAHAVHAAEARTESLSTSQAAAFRAALAKSPIVRPEVVDRASQLAIDPNYPPLAIIERVASLIAATQDPSEQVD